MLYNNEHAVERQRNGRKKETHSIALKIANDFKNHF